MTNDIQTHFDHQELAKLLREIVGHTARTNELVVTLHNDLDNANTNRCDIAHAICDSIDSLRNTLTDLLQKSSCPLAEQCDNSTEICLVAGFDYTKCIFYQDDQLKPQERSCVDCMHLLPDDGTNYEWCAKVKVCDRKHKSEWQPHKPATNAGCPLYGPCEHSDSTCRNPWDHSQCHYYDLAPTDDHIGDANKKVRHFVYKLVEIYPDQSVHIAGLGAAMKARREHKHNIFWAVEQMKVGETVEHSFGPNTFAVDAKGYIKCNGGRWAPHIDTMLTAEWKLARPKK